MAIFRSPSYVSELDCSPPDSLLIHDFLFRPDDRFGRHPVSRSGAPFTCALTGASYSAAEVTARIEALASALAATLHLSVDVAGGQELDRVISVFCYNAIDSLTISWATHRLSGVSAPISTASSVQELSRQLKQSRTKALFTCAQLLPVALKAAEEVGLPQSCIFLVNVSQKKETAVPTPSGFKSVDDLIREGEQLPSLPALCWAPGQGARQVAYLCSSSGTSGTPKSAMISHRNVIANVLQYAAFEGRGPEAARLRNLAVLPLNHCYALIMTAHFAIYRGDEVFILPEFDIHQVLSSIQTHRLEVLWMVPPMLLGMAKVGAALDEIDLSSVTKVVVAASKLTQQVADQFSKIVPDCVFVQAYGLTEAAVGVSIQSLQDPMTGSCGSLLPGFEAKLLDAQGQAISALDTPGELLLRSPSVIIGYLNNEEATKATITPDGWLRTGDMFEVRKSERGHQHLFLVDRIKELIKVRGLQVSPIELETCITKHPAIKEAIVVPIPSDAAGELPLAFITKTAAGEEMDETVLRDEIHALVQNELADYKRLAGGIHFVDSLPKTTTAKIERGVMKKRAIALYESSKKRGVPTVVHVIEFDSDEDISDIEDDEE